MPTQATNTTSGNWKARFKAEFYDYRGRNWRIELIDNDSSTSADQDFSLSSTQIVDARVSDQGFSLNWDGPTDHVGGAIIPSTCEVTWVITDNDLEGMKNGIKNAEDGRLGLAIYYDDGGTHWKPYWVGLLTHEAIEYETQDLPYLVRMRASCGLNRLGDIEFSDNDEPYTNDVSLAGAIARCINKLPTANFWTNTENQLNEVVDLFNEYHHNTNTQSYTSWASQAEDPYPISMIERTVVASPTFFEEKKTEEDEYGRRVRKPPNFTSCLDVLENICTAFSARFTQARFGWWFIPPNAFNWSHDLNVQSWTRTQVASENIATEQDGSNDNKDTSTATQTNFRRDIETTHALENGWSNSYLLPVKRTVLTFKNSGLRSVLGPPRNINLDHNSTGNGFSVHFTNQTITTSEADTLTIKGSYNAPLQTEYGTTAANYGRDRIGARIILRLKIMLNTQNDPATGNPAGTVYYYGSEYSVNSPQACVINYPAFYDGLGANGSEPFHTLSLEDPTWGTTEKFFDIVIPWTNSEAPAPSILNSTEGLAVGGLHIKPDGENNFKFVNSSVFGDTSQQESISHSFDFTTAPLPNALTTYSGIDIQIARVCVTRNGTLKENFPDMANIFEHSSTPRTFFFDGTTNPDEDEFAPLDYVNDLLVIVGEESEDADHDYFCEQANSSEHFYLGETTIGSNYTTEGNGSDGAVRMITHNGNTTNANLFSTPKWRSVTDEISDEDSPAELQFTNLKEQLYMRSKALDVQRGTIVPQVSTAANYTAPFDIISILHHNCSDPADIEDYLLPLTMTHNAKTDSYEVDAVLLSRARLSFTSDSTKIPKGDTNAGGGAGGSGGGVAPVGTGDSGITNGGNSTSTKEVLDKEEIATLKSFQASFVTTTTPTGTVTDSTPAVGDTVTFRASNFDGVTTYKLSLEESDGTVVLSQLDFTQSGKDITFTYPNNNNTLTLKVSGVSVGQLESAQLSVSMQAATSHPAYYRFQVVDIHGAASSKYIRILEVSLFDAINYGGTDNPTAAATAHTNTGFTISHGYENTSSSTNGRSWNAWDNNNSGTYWSSEGLAKTSVNDNWCQIEFTGTAPAVESLQVVVASGNTLATNLKVMSSTTGAFSGEETTITTFSNVGTGLSNQTLSFTN